MIPLTDEENRSYENQIFCHVCRKLFTKDDKKVKDNCHFTGKYRGPAHNKCKMNYKITKSIPIVFYNLSSYDGHFIIKELANEFDGGLECLGENTENCISFSVKINKKITNKDEDGNKKIVNIPYRLKLIDSYRFMAASLSELVNNLSNGLHSKKCTDCGLNLEYMIAKDDILIFRCFRCKRNCEIDFAKELNNKFSSLYYFCKGDINKFILLLRKGVYPYEYMHSWNRFNEKSLPDKKYFYSCLNKRNIIDIDYTHATRVFKAFKMNNLGDYHDLYVQSDTLLLADIFENFRDMNNYDENKESSSLSYLDANNLYGCPMIKKLSVGGFNWVKNVSRIDEEFIKNYDENSDIGYFLNVDLEYPKESHDFHSDLPFLPEKMRINKHDKLVCTLYDKKNMLHT